MPKVRQTMMIMLMKLIRRYIEPQQAMRLSQFEILPEVDADLLFLGDSLTEFGLWEEWFPHLTVINRGIGGDTSAGVLQRLDSAIGKQRQLFLLIGTNDLSLGISHQVIAANVEMILKRVAARAADTEVFVQSVMPRSPIYRDDIAALNKRLKTVAEANGAVFLDLWPALSNEGGGIRIGFSLDKIHLTGQGYEAWVKVLRDHVRV